MFLQSTRIRFIVGLGGLLILTACGSQEDEEASNSTEEDQASLATQSETEAEETETEETETEETEPDPRIAAVSPEGVCQKLSDRVEEDEAWAVVLDEIEENEAGSCVERMEERAAIWNEENPDRPDRVLGGYDRCLDTAPSCEADTTEDSTNCGDEAVSQYRSCVERDGTAIDDSETERVEVRGPGPVIGPPILRREVLDDGIAVPSRPRSPR